MAGVGPLILVVSPNTGIDITYEVTGFATGRVNRAARQEPMIGGKPVNVVRTLARLGVGAEVFTFCDSAHLPFLRRELGALDAVCHVTPAGRALRYCSIVVDARAKTSTVVNGPGPLIEESEAGRFLQNVENALAQDGHRYLVLSGSLPPGLPDDTYGKLVRAAKKYGKYAVVDAAGAVLREAAGASPDLGKVNEEEFGVLAAGRTVDVAALEYLDRIGTLIVTAGAAGAVCYHGGRRYQVEPLGGFEPVNPTGCGDAFLGGYVAGLVRGYPVPECLRLANAAAYANLLDLLPDIGNHVDKIRLFEKNTVVRETVL